MRKISKAVRQIKTQLNIFTAAVLYCVRISTTAINRFGNGILCSLCRTYKSEKDSVPFIAF